MTPDRCYASLCRRLAAFLPVGALLAGGWAVYATCSLPSPSVRTDSAASVAVAVQPVDLPADLDWSVFRGERTQAPTARDALSRRFRLAGTFFVYGSGAADTRKAVLHDLEDGVQHIAGEHAMIGQVEIVRIMGDRVVLRRGAEEAELWLGFSRSDPSGGTDGATGTADPAKGVNAFGGRKTGEHEWVFQREALRRYYEEVLDDPERLVRIFDSMKAVRGGDRRITGYRLDILGESEFYHAVGMRQGDVVRKVNDMSMTSRRRAEHLIGQFYRDRSNAFVMEIERDGKPVTLTYQVR